MTPLYIWGDGPAPGELPAEAEHTEAPADDGEQLRRRIEDSKYEQ